MIIENGPLTYLSRGELFNEKILWRILFISLLIVLLTACEQTTEATLTGKEETIQESLIDKSTFLSDYTYGKIVDEAFISDYNLVFFKKISTKTISFMMHSSFMIMISIYSLILLNT
jgi:hypothetical protein